jgi:hypothetical protein
MEKYLQLVFGASWRTSLIGYLGAALLELGIALDALPAGAWPGWHFVALFLVAIARAMKDGAVTGGSVPVTPEAKIRMTWPTSGPGRGATLLVLLACLAAAPAFAQDVDPTAANSDPGAVIADQVANGAPDFRFGTVLPLPGRPVLIPAVAITPFALSLRNGAITTGLTVGGGYELLWHATEASARGVAVYANIRSTSDGPRPLVSVLGILTPYLGAGIGYQIGGGAASFRDAAVLLVSVGTNLGLAAPGGTVSPAP